MHVIVARFRTFTAQRKHTSTLIHNQQYCLFTLLVGLVSILGGNSITFVAPYLMIVVL